MTTHNGITSTSLKKDIYAAYLELKQQQDSQTITGAQLVNTTRLVVKEAELLARDCRIAGTVARQWISGVIDVLSRPVLKSI